MFWMLHVVTAPIRVVLLRGRTPHRLSFDGTWNATEEMPGVGDCPARVDEQVGAGDGRCTVRQEELDTVGDFIRLDAPPERHLGVDVCRVTTWRTRLNP